VLAAGHALYEGLGGRGDEVLQSWGGWSSRNGSKVCFTLSKEVTKINFWEVCLKNKKIIKYVVNNVFKDTCYYFKN
jgi:hypothetical protein